MKFRSLICAAVAAALASCSYITKKDAAPLPPVIRYINLKAVYGFAMNRSRDALDVRKKLDQKLARMREIERALDDQTTDHVALLEEYRAVKKDLDALKSRSRYFKSRLLTQIERAVKNVAAEAKADFIYNIGEELLYAKREYDVSEDVIREIIRLEERKSPEAR
jgi:Skp family chaperone for outer membrane proteins